MPRKILVDAGPLIALFDKSDRHHERVKGFLKTYKGQLVSTWPVLTETTHMLDFHIPVQIDFLTWVQWGGVTRFPLEHGHLERIIALSKKYTDLPMDLADGSLIVAAEVLGIEEILSIDSDYDVYRTIRKTALRNVLLQ